MPSVGPPHSDQQSSSSEEDLESRRSSVGEGVGFWEKLSKGISRTAHSLGGMLSKSLPEVLRGLSERKVESAEPGKGRRIPPEESARDLAIDKFMTGLVPAGLKVVEDNHLGGELALYRTSFNCRVWSSGLQPALESVARRLLADPRRGALGATHDQPLAHNAGFDLARLRVVLPSGFSTRSQPFAKIEEELRAFAGSDGASRVLSAVARPQILSPLEFLETAGGDPITFVPPQPCLEGAVAPIRNYRFIDAQGVTHDLGRKPGRYSAAVFKFDRGEEGDFLVGLDWPLYVAGFRTVGEINLAPLGGNDYLMKLHFRSQWRIDAMAAEQGRLQFQIVQPVTVSFEGLLR